jgi:hypothetical protein
MVDPAEQNDTLMGLEKTNTHGKHSYHQRKVKQTQDKTIRWQNVLTQWIVHDE